MKHPNLPDDISRDDIHLMRQLGISGMYISHVLRKNGWSSMGDLPEPTRKITHPLTDTEIAIFRAGGARGLEDTPETRLNLLKGLHDKLRECRTLLKESYDLNEAASLLRISVAETESKAHRIPPELHSFEIEPDLLRFPRWQFTDSGTIPYLTELLNAVGAVNTFIFNWFMLTPNTELEIEDECLCPRDWLVRGLYPDLVLSAAKALSHE